MIVTFKTAKLAKVVGFSIECYNYYKKGGELEDRFESSGSSTDTDIPIYLEEFLHNYNSGRYMGAPTFSAPTQSELHKYIRENRGVNISVYPNASSWLWSFTEVDERGFGGTDLGWCGDTESGFSGPNLSGGWDSYEEATENALQVQLSYSREEWEKERKGHIRGYAAEAIKKHKEIKI